MTLYPDPTQRPVNGADGWLTFRDIPPAPPADPRRQQLLDLAAEAEDMGAVDLLVNVIRITGDPRLNNAQALLDLLGASKNLGDLGDGADPAQMLGGDYAGPNGADLAREAMVAAQKDALDRLLGGAA